MLMPVPLATSCQRASNAGFLDDALGH
jgi:hypothetical protein